MTRVIVLCDLPTITAQLGFDQFIENNSALQELGQIVVLPRGSLEECYPEEWRKNEDQTKAMSDHQKKQLSKLVGVK